ncbi:MAG: T9SS type A sorting domain-containing protein [Lentimicrobiaceae bacterium]|jgi:hypothetical protein|nr:T9SS type A sorting domain-containing protein [Lentimicrobiaceae bacterium]
MKIKISNKKRFVLAIVLFIGTICPIKAQIPTLPVQFDWQTCMEQQMSLRLLDINDGFFAINTDFLHDGAYIYGYQQLLKYNLQGELEWKKDLGDGYGSFLIKDNNSRDYYLVPDRTGDKKVIMKFNQYDELVWTKNLTLDDNYTGNGVIAITATENGFATISDDTAKNFNLYQYNSDGELLNTHHIIDFNRGNPNIISTSDNGFLITTSIDFSNGPVILKMNANKEIEWSVPLKEINQTPVSGTYFLIEVEGGFLMSLISTKPCIAKINHQGVVDWTYSDDNVRLFRALETNNGNIVCFGEVNPSNFPIYILTLNASGKPLSQSFIDNNDGKFLYISGVVPVKDKDNTYVISAEYAGAGGDITTFCNSIENEFYNYHDDFWLAQITLKKGDDSDGIDEYNTLQATVYPNPAADYMLIECAEYENATFVVYDLVGRVLYRQLLNGEKSYINTSGFKNGMYVYQIQSNDKKNIGKMVITH